MADLIGLWLSQSGVFVISIRCHCVEIIEQSLQYAARRCENTIWICKPNGTFTSGTYCCGTFMSDVCGLKGPTYDTLVVLLVEV